MEKKLVSLVPVFLSKTHDRIPSSSSGRQVARPSSLPVLEAYYDEKRQMMYELIRQRKKIYNKYTMWLENK